MSLEVMEREDVKDMEEAGCGRKHEGRFEH